VAACDGTGPNTCYDSNAFSYGFALGGDSTLVFRWPAGRMPVRYYAEPTGALRANVLASLTTWVNAFQCQEASFQLVTDSSRAEVIVRQVATLPPTDAGSVVLAADSVGACSGLTHGYFDSTNTLTGPMRTYVAPLGASDTAALAACYRMVTTHELGHTLGLFAHSPNVADLMYPTPRRSTPSPDDRYTLQRLYHTTPTIRPAPRVP
jgi:predicted Zn-dependent protease